MTIIHYGDYTAQQVSGRIGGYCATRAALTSIVPFDRQNGMLILVGDDLYRFSDAGSASTPGAIVPDTGTGVWQTVGANAILSAALPSDLTLIDDTELNAGYKVFVSCHDVTWTLSKTSTRALDPNTVRATLSATGRWIRDVVGSSRWTLQTQWDINSVTGDDVNSGLLGDSLPIKTLNEMIRRLRQVIAGTTYTANVSTDGLPSSDQVRWNGEILPGSAGDAKLVIKCATTNAVSSTFTATAAAAPGSDTAASVTDATVTWSAQIGSILTATSGAASGATAGVGIANGTSAYVSDWVFPLTGVFSPTPAPGDTYVMKTYPTVAAGCGGQGMSPRMVIDFVSLRYTGANQMQMNVNFRDCQVQVALAAANAPSHNVTLFGCTASFGSLSNFVNNDNQGLVFNFVGGAFINCVLQCSSLGVFVMRGLFVGCDIGSAVAPQVTVHGGQFNIAAPTGIFNAPSGKNGITLRRATGLSISPSAGLVGLYGTGSNLKGISVNEGSSVLIPSGVTPRLTGSGGDLQLDGMSSAYQQLELSAGGALPSLVALATWADLTGAVVLGTSGFAGNVFSHKTGARFIRTA